MGSFEGEDFHLLLRSFEDEDLQLLMRSFEGEDFMTVHAKDGGVDDR